MILDDGKRYREDERRRVTTFSFRIPGARRTLTSEGSKEKLAK